MTNELRGGFNLAPAKFETDWDFGEGMLYTTPLITTPRANFQAQGHDTNNTCQLSNNATLLAGDHQLEMGGS